MTIDDKGFNVMIKKLIVLDCDGVLADLASAKKILGYGYDDEGVLGDRQHEFWANLPVYPWAKKLYSELSTLAPVLVATSLNTAYPFAYSGRVVWLKRHLEISRFLIGPPKLDLAMPGRVLIDDSRPTCKGWEQRGGRALPFPRAWLGESVDVERVIEQVTGLL